MIDKDPEQKIVDFFNYKTIKIIIRGELKSSKVLLYIKKKLNVKKIYRIACLQKKDKKFFFMAPVGVDDGESVKNKIQFLMYGLKLLKKVKLKAKIGVFEHEIISELKKVPFLFSNIKKNCTIKVYLNIKDAYLKCNYLIFPNGITGNLVFRTLTHLCYLDGFGAMTYFDLNKLNNKIYIDTSRSLSHYINAIKFSIFILYS